MNKIKVSNIEWGVPELELPFSVEIDLGIIPTNYFLFLKGILLNVDKVEMEEHIEEYIVNEYGNKENEYYVKTKSFDWEIIYE